MATYINNIAFRIFRKAEPEASIVDLHWSLYRIYAVLALGKGENTTLEDVHNAWAAWESGINQAHPCLVPFGSLTLNKQDLDIPYAKAIRDVAAELKRENA